MFFGPPNPGTSQPTLTETFTLTTTVTEKVMVTVDKIF